MENAVNTVEIKGSPGKLLGLTALGILMTAASGFIVVGPDLATAGSLNQFFGLVGVLFFGACTIVAVLRFLQASKVVVTLSNTGIHDLRLSERLVPWETIKDIGVWQMSGQKIIVLKVPQKTEADIGLTRMARWSRGANTKLGADGLCIATSGLKISHDALLAAITARTDAAQAANG